MLVAQCTDFFEALCLLATINQMAHHKAPSWSKRRFMQQISRNLIRPNIMLLPDQDSKSTHPLSTAWPKSMCMASPQATLARPYTVLKQYHVRPVVRSPYHSGHAPFFSNLNETDRLPRMQAGKLCCYVCADCFGVCPCIILRSHPAFGCTHGALPIAVALIGTLTLRPASIYDQQMTFQQRNRLWCPVTGTLPSTFLAEANIGVRPLSLQLSACDTRPGRPLQGRC